MISLALVQRELQLHKWAKLGFQGHISVSSKNGGAELTTEFDQANMQIPTPEFYKDNDIKVFQELENLK